MATALRRGVENEQVLTTNTSTTAYMWGGGTGFRCAFGTFDGGTITTAYSPNLGTTWITQATQTADGGNAFDLPAGYQIRFTLSGAGASASVTCQVCNVQPLSQTGI